jgi:hypothetical protein
MIGNGSWHYNDIYKKFQSAYADKDPKTMFSYSGIIAGKDGNKRLDGFSNYWYFTMINQKAAEDKKVKSLEMLDYLCSEEGRMLMRWGIEGTHYKKDGDKYTSLLGNDDKGNPQVLSAVDPTCKLKFLVTWDSDYIPENTQNRDEILKCGREGIENSNPDPLVALALDEKAAPAETSSAIWEYTKETLVKIIAKSKDLDKDWDEFVKSWLAKGGQQVWDETNRKALEEGR